MASNPYFNNFEFRPEQSLIDDLITETMGIYGYSFYYLPRVLVNEDKIYTEDSISEYNSAFLLDMYVKSFNSYQGQGSFLSRIGYEIRDQITLTLSRSIFEDKIKSVTGLIRAREGDIIYSPMMKRMFVIKYVNNTPTFYQAGSLYVWELVCEVWEYSSERFNTGIAEIDQIERDYSINQATAGILTSNSSMLTDSSGFPLMLGQFSYEQQLSTAVERNTVFESQANNFVNWSTSNPFDDGAL